MQDVYKLVNQTTTELLGRESELVKKMLTLSAYHNRKMSKRDRLFFTELYRAESTAITAELMRREEVAA